MRKRVISLLLSLCMLLALVPATVIAESAQPTQSGLYCRWVDWDDNDDPFISDDEPYLSSLDMKRTNGYEFVFYYIDDAGTTTRLSYEDLTFPDFLENRSETEGDFSYIYLRPSAFGSGKITYVEANAALPVTVGLPVVGFYKKPIPSEDAFLSEISDKTGGREQTVYFCWNPEQIPDAQSLEVEYQKRGQNRQTVAFNDEALAEIGLTAEPHFKEGYVKLTIQIRNGITLGLRLLGANGRSSKAWLEISKELADPGLSCRQVDWRNSTPYISDGEPYLSSLDTELTYDYNYVFYYTDDAGTTTQLSYEDLTFPEDIVEVEPEAAPGFSYVWLNALALGKGTITYTKDGKTYSLPVTVNLPEVGFYKEPSISEGAFLSEISDKTGGREQTVYFCWDKAYASDAESLQVEYQKRGQSWQTVDFNNEALAEIGLTAEPHFKEGYVKLTIQIRNGISLILRLLGANGRRYDRALLEISKELADPGLSCRRVYFDTEGNLDVSSFQLYIDNMDVGYDHLFIFYYTDDNGTTKPLSFDDLAFPAFVGAQPGSSWISLCPSTFGSGEITYELEGKTYALPVLVKLPDIGFFSAPEASEESYLQRGVTGPYGTTETVYFLWPEDFYNGDLRVSLEIEKSFATHQPQQLLNAADLRDVAVQETLRQAGIDIQEINTEERYIKMAVSVKNTSAHLIIRSNGGFGTDIYTDQPAHETTSFQYKGNDYLFCMGEPEGDRFGFGDNSWRIGTGFTRGEGAIGVRDVFFALVQNYRADNQQEAPSACYRWISDVSFEMVGVHDPDDPENKPTIQLEKMPPIEYHGCLLPAVRMTATEPCQGYLRVHYTVTLPGEQPREMADDYIVFFYYYSKGTLDAADLDTAEKLNAVFADSESFMAWLQEKHPEVYADSKDNADFGYTIQLPAVRYDDIITVNADLSQGIYLEGAIGEDGGKATVMPGMRLENVGHFCIRNIAFEANEALLQTKDGERFTCGVLTIPEYDRQCGAYIWNCSFRGFDYGVRNTPTGYLCPASGNLFEDCKVGYLMDCGGKRSGHMNSIIEDSAFVRCGTAIQVNHIPECYTPYDFRVVGCDFIDNGTDLDMRQQGIFYLWKNYYGYTNPLSLGASLLEYLPRPSRIHDENGALPVTNPRYAFPCSRFFAEDRHNPLYLDPHRLTMIVNSDARDLLLDRVRLEQEAAENGVTIAVTDKEGNTQGVWTFAKDK